MTAFFGTAWGKAIRSHHMAHHFAVPDKNFGISHRWIDAVVGTLRRRDQRDTENISERLLQTTRAAASSEENMLAASEQIMRALANLPAVRDGTAGCDHALSDALRGLVLFTDMARIDRNGRVWPGAVGVRATTDGRHGARRSRTRRHQTRIGLREI